MRLRVGVMLVSAALLSGCATLEAGLTNRLTTSAAMDECRVDSRWGPVGVSTKLDVRDCEVVLEGMLVRIERMLRNVRSQVK